MSYSWKNWIRNWGSKLRRKVGFQASILFENSFQPISILVLQKYWSSVKVFFNFFLSLFTDASSAKLYSKSHGKREKINPKDELPRNATYGYSTSKTKPFSRKSSTRHSHREIGGKVAEVRWQYVRLAEILFLILR